MLAELTIGNVAILIQRKKKQVKKKNRTTKYSLASRFKLFYRDLILFLFRSPTDMKETAFKRMFCCVS